MNVIKFMGLLYPCCASYGRNMRERYVCAIENEAIMKESSVALIVEASGTCSMMFVYLSLIYVDFIVL